MWITTPNFRVFYIFGTLWISSTSMMVRVFTNGLGDQGSITGQVIPKTQKIVLDAALLSTQHYKVQIKGNGAIQGKEYCSPLHLGVVAIKKGTFGSPSTMVINFTFYFGFQAKKTNKKLKHKWQLFTYKLALLPRLRGYYLCPWKSHGNTIPSWSLALVVTPLFLSSCSLFTNWLTSPPCCMSFLLFFKRKKVASYFLWKQRNRDSVNKVTKLSLEERNQMAILNMQVYQQFSALVKHFSSGICDTWSLMASFIFFACQWLYIYTFLKFIL